MGIGTGMATERTARGRRAGAVTRWAGLAPVAIAAMLAVASFDALAQAGWQFKPEVGATVTWTSNSAYATNRPEESDTILSLRPRLYLYRRAPDFTVEGNVGFDVVHYLEGTRSNDTRPAGELAVRARPGGGPFHLDAEAAVESRSLDPYSGFAEDDSTANEYRFVRYRLTPYLDHQIRPGLQLLARADNVWTRRIGGESVLRDLRRDAYVQQQIVRLEQQPQRLGYWVEAYREDTRYRYASDTTLRLEALRASVTYAVTSQFSIGPLAGVERTRYSLTDTTDTIYGLQATWEPSERSRLAGRLEHRFMGAAWDVEWRHRSPFVTLYVRWLRLPSTQVASQVLSPELGTDVRTLVDALLTTRIPDPVQRTEAVQRLISELGLPPTLSSALELFAGYAQLQRSVSATALFSGRRTTVSLTAYRTKYERLPDEDLGATLGASAADNRQHGVEADFSRRLTPLLVGGLTVRYAKIEGLGASLGTATDERSVRARLNFNLSPRTTFTLGLRRRLLDSNIVTSGNETAVIAGLVHRY